MVRRQGDALDYTDPNFAACGISGRIPQTWRNRTRKDVQTQLPGFLQLVDLSGNQLMGSLPDIIGGPNVIYNMRQLHLQHNKFTGRVPDAWSQLQPLDERGNPDVIQTLNIRQNQLAGPLPVSLSNLEEKLNYLYLDGNAQLSGCVPLTPFTAFTYTGTQVVGRCSPSAARDVMHKQQRDAFMLTLCNRWLLMWIQICEECCTMLCKR
ncbi:hypothetical protein COO60DRAFT_1148812 [Scenedesmus sp. NREL 46B-D3]|nr:hypothetical protein COO60DRAFT_1148812 [Scenedesmus sp. NREL 46B-D3]